MEKKILNGDLDYYNHQETFNNFNKNDLRAIIPIAFIQEPELYRRLLESFLRDLDNDILFDPEKIEIHQPVVMTEKDAVICKSFASNNFWMLTTNIELEDSFIDLLVRKIDSCKQNIV